MSLVDRVRQALTGDDRVDAEQLVARLEALQRFLRVTDPYLPDHDLVAAHTLVERAGSRLALSQDHTVVALAGSTGSGKSSLFNALARLKLSPVGVRRPTTGVAHATVWGSGSTTCASSSRRPTATCRPCRSRPECLSHTTFCAPCGWR